jgi:hypothetical protein
MLRYRHHRSILIDVIAKHAADATLHVLRYPEAVRRFCNGSHCFPSTFSR